jgi:hypothetical protein
MLAIAGERTPALPTFSGDGLQPGGYYFCEDRRLSMASLKLV